MWMEGSRVGRCGSRKARWDSGKSSAPRIVVDDMIGDEVAWVVVETV